MFCLNDSFKTNLNNFTKFKVGIIYDIVRNALVLKNPFKLQKKIVTGNRDIVILSKS